MYHLPLPLRAGQPTEQDPYWENVRVLLQFHGGEGSTIIIDSSGHAAPAIPSGGAAVQTMTNSLFGKSVLRTAPYGSTSLEYAVKDTNLYLGSDNWTFEWWGYRDGVHAGSVFRSQNNWSSMDAQSYSFFDSSTSSWVYVGATKYPFGQGAGGHTYSPPNPTGEWNFHYTERDGDFIYDYIGGQLATVTPLPAGAYLNDAGIEDHLLPATIGFGGDSMVGFLGPMRLTVGVARRTGAIIPTGPFLNAPYPIFTPSGMGHATGGCEFPILIAGNLYGIQQNGVTANGYIVKYSGDPYAQTGYSLIDDVVYKLIRVGDRMYTASCSSPAVGKVSKLNYAAMTLGGSIVEASVTMPASGEPQDLCYCQGALWITLQYSGKIRKLDVNTLATLADVTAAAGRIATDGTNLWIDHNATSVLKLDGTTGATLATFVLGYWPRDLEIVGQHLYVVKSDAAISLEKYDKDTGAFVASYDMTGDYFGHTYDYLNTDGTYLSFGRNFIQILDDSRGIVINKLGSGRWSAGFSDLGKLILGNANAGGTSFAGFNELLLTLL